MRLVKICSNCHFCNNQKRDTCEKCSSLLNDESVFRPKDLIFDDVIDDLEKEETKDTIADLKTQNKKVKICPEDQHANPENVMFCQKCHRPLINVLAAEIETPNVELIQEKSPITFSGYEDELVYVKLKNESSQIEIVFSKNKGVFGRNDLHNGDVYFKTISREHFIYFIEDGLLYIIDQSTNGTEINKTLLEKNKKYVLNNRDIIKLANHVFIVDITKKV